MCLCELGSLAFIKFQVLFWESKNFHCLSNFFFFLIFFHIFTTGKKMYFKGSVVLLESAVQDKKLSNPV